MTVPGGAQSHARRQALTDTAWTGEGLCRGLDPELFFPVGNAEDAQRQAAEAKALCARCPVREACLGYAKATRQEAGIWGGMIMFRGRPRSTLPGNSTAGARWAQ